MGSSAAFSIRSDEMSRRQGLTWQRRPLAAPRVSRYAWGRLGLALPRRQGGPAPRRPTTRSSRRWRRRSGRPLATAGDTAAQVGLRRLSPGASPAGWRSFGTVPSCTSRRSASPTQSSAWMGLMTLPSLRSRPSTRTCSAAHHRGCPRNATWSLLLRQVTRRCLGPAR